MPATKRQRQYYARHDFGLQNGSFFRDVDPSGEGGFAEYINGDFMGCVGRVPEEFKLQDREHARRLVPAICRD
jgi:hypothetical protein